MSSNSHNDVARPPTRSRRTSSGSSVPSLQSPKTPRFTEATAVISPVEPATAAQQPFQRSKTTHFAPQPQPVDTPSASRRPTFGVEMQDEQEIKRMPDANNPGTPLWSPPLKSALKTPGTAKQTIFSPTFHEEEVLEKREKSTEKEQEHDLKIKTRVRMAKFLLRGVNFSCSLIVLSMLSATFTIFNATKNIPTRMINSSKFPPWAVGQKIWPQIAVLVIACISLTMSIGVMYAYYRGRFRRAQKVAIYYTMFAIASFVFSTVMWIIGAAILHGSKVNGNKQDMWGWSCNENTRASLFQSEVDYNLICRFQNWSLVCCVIEIVVEVITISIYGVIAYRLWSKRRLRKSMANRDKARSDLYLAELRLQSQPNTPGVGPNGPYTPYAGDYKSYPYAHATEMEDGMSSETSSVQYADAKVAIAQPKPFVLQPPPIKIQGPTPRMQQTGFTPIELPRTTPSPALSQAGTATYGFPPPTPNRVAEHVPAAKGEQVYDAVPIPGAYAHPGSPTSPGFH